MAGLGGIGRGLAVGKRGNPPFPINLAFGGADVSVSRVMVNLDARLTRAAGVGHKSVRGFSGADFGRLIGLSEDTERIGTETEVGQMRARFGAIGHRMPRPADFHAEAQILMCPVAACIAREVGGFFSPLNYPENWHLPAAPRPQRHRVWRPAPYPALVAIAVAPHCFRA